MNHTTRLTLGLLCLVLLGSGREAMAATLYLDPGVSTVYRGDSITLSVRLMPDQATGECINAIDASISFPPHLQAVDVSVGRSIFPLWIEPPAINQEARVITFAGGIPNGYCGRIDGDPRLTNIIADIVFRSPGNIIGASPADQAVVDFLPETRVILNDEFGTEAPLRTLGATINLDRNPGPALTDNWRSEVQADDIPPESFSITLAQDDITFGGRYYIVFNTTDKQTGLSHYEVMEEPVTELGQFTWGAVGVPWLRVNSPYPLKDQSLNSVIRVKAIDKAGNEYIATLVPDPSMQTISRQTQIAIGLGVLAAILLVSFGYFGWRWYRRRSRQAPTVVTDSEVKI